MYGLEAAVVQVREGGLATDVATIRHHLRQLDDVLKRVLADLLDMAVDGACEDRFLEALSAWVGKPTGPWSRTRLTECASQPAAPMQTAEDAGSGLESQSDVSELERLAQLHEEAQRLWRSGRPIERPTLPG